MRARLAPTRPNARQHGARFALIVLTLVQSLNYADRYVPASVKELIQADLHLSDAESALPTTGMVVVYMVMALVFGHVADRDLVDRRLILVGAVVFWSIATAAAGLATGLASLVALRALVGVGEAAYATLVPALIADFYPPHERTVAFGVYAIAPPVGGALGYGAGAVLGGLFGWRAAFLVVALPGVAAAALVALIDDPPRGINDGARLGEREGLLADGDGAAPTSPAADLRAILSNAHYVSAQAGSTANSFAIGALSEWLATFLLRYQGVGLQEAGLVVGAATCVAGVAGTVLGAKATNAREGRWRSAPFAVSALFTLPAALFTFGALTLARGRWAAYTCLFLGNTCLFTFIAPIGNVAISVVPAPLRARSSGLGVLATHVLGDVIAPPIVGAVSDAYSLRAGLQLAWIAMLASGGAWAVAAVCLAPPPVAAPSADGDERAPTYCALLCRPPPDAEKRGAAPDDAAAAPPPHGGADVGLIEMQDTARRRAPSKP